jgi:hypothetical protein
VNGHASGVGANGTVSVFGHDEPDRWRNHANLSLHLNASGPVEIEGIAHGTIDCLAFVEDFDEGAWTRTSQSTVLRDASR